MRGKCVCWVGGGGRRRSLRQAISLSVGVMGRIDPCCMLGEIRSALPQDAPWPAAQQEMRAKARARYLRCITPPECQFFPLTQPETSDDQLSFYIIYCCWMLIWGRTLVVEFKKALSLAFSQGFPHSRWRTRWVFCRARGWRSWSCV